MRRVAASSLRRLAGAALLAAVLVGSATGDSFDGSTADVWDLAQGTVVTAHSGVGGGSSIDDLFGGAASAVETKTTIFADGNSAGFVHFVEWRTPAPVTVDGFTVRANDDFDRSGARGFSTFRLFARNAGSGDFDKLHEYDVPRNPYGEHILVTGTFAPVTAQEFRAEFVQAGPPGTGGPRVREIDAPLPVVPVDGYLLPLKAKVKANAADPAKSRLTAGGILDTGAAATAFGTPVTLDAGTLHTEGATPTQAGSAFRVEQGGFLFTVKPSPIGSSRAKFKMTFTGDVTGAVDGEARLDLGYADSGASVRGTPRLEDGTFKLSRTGSLRAPVFNLVRAKAKLLGGGKDTLSLVLAVRRVESIPTSPFDVRLEFGEGFQVTLPADAFARKGETFVLQRPVGGITKATVAFGSGLISISGKGLDLGAFAGGSSVVRIALALGPDRREVTVRLGRTGSLLKY